MDMIIFILNHILNHNKTDMILWICQFLVAMCLDHAWSNVPEKSRHGENPKIQWLMIMFPVQLQFVFFFYLWAYTIFRHTHITVLIINYIYIYGWWFQPLWKILVSWDDCSQCMEKKFQTINQFYICVYVCIILSVFSDFSPSPGPSPKYMTAKNTWLGLASPSISLKSPPQKKIETQTIKHLKTMGKIIIELPYWNPVLSCSISLVGSKTINNTYNLGT